MTRRTSIGTGSAASILRDGAVVALVLGCGLAFAAGPATRFHVDQPAQPMAESLRDIARQTGTSVLFDPARVKGRTARAVHGQLTAAEALTQALEGSGLQAQVLPDGSVVVRPGAAVGAASGADSGTAPGATSGATSGAPPAAGPASGPRGGGARASESPAGAGHGIPLSVAADPNTDAPARERPGEDVALLAKVEVTGSRLKRIDADGATPINVYTRKDMDRSGQPTLERFLGSLNEISVSSGEGSLGLTSGQATVQLRGLPVGSTLVLVNGRRLQAVGSSSADFFNLNLIPLAAVERVEIVPVGSSAVYGGDALAGVVNIILKKTLDGTVADARWASAKGTRDRGLSVGTGGHGERGSYLVLGAYSKTTPLSATERAFFQNADYRRFGGVDGRTQSCTPGTVTSATGANLPGLNASFAGIPAAAAAAPSTLTMADFASSAGQANLCNPLANGHGTALVYGSEHYAAHALGEHLLSDDWTVFGELSLTRERMAADEAGLELSDVLVPAANPYNPFGTDVRVTSRLGLQNGSERISRKTDFKRLLVGLRGELGAGWDAEVSLSTTRDDGNRHLVGSPKWSLLDAALGASTAAAALNPFTAAAAGSPELIRSIWPDAARMNHGRKDQASAFVRGSLLTLPSGSVDVIAGAETTHDRYHTFQVGSFDIEASRSAHAFYGEVRVPLMRTAASTGASASDGSGPTREMAALTLAGRRDRYSDFGGASTYQAGLEFRPAKSLLLRGSVATSFKPPTLLETHVDDLTYATDDFGLVDPARANAPVVGGEVLRATNPNLHPEKGRAYAFGAVWEPESLLGTRLAATAWRVKINGLIALLWPQVVLDNEALFPGLITRAAGTGGLPGPITNVLWTETNFGSVSTSGVDLELAHAWKSEVGKWTASASATRTTRYDVVITPDAPVDDRLGRRAEDFWSPRWKGRLSLALDRGAWSLGLTSRYLGGYQDMAPGGALGNYWVHDLAWSINLRRAGLNLPGAKQASLSLAIANLTNRLPQAVSTYPYFDVTQADWRGRFASLRLSAAF